MHGAQIHIGRVGRDRVVNHPPARPGPQALSPARLPVRVRREYQKLKREAADREPNRRGGRGAASLNSRAPRLSLLGGGARCWFQPHIPL